MDRPAPMEEELERQRQELTADLASAWIRASGEERRRKKLQIQNWIVQKPGKPKK